MNESINRGAGQAKSTHKLFHWLLLLAVALALAGTMMAGAPAVAQSGTVTSSVAPSNATPSIGQQVVVTINIDMSNVAAPDNNLGSFTGSLDWAPAILAYHSNSGILAGFTGVVNTSGAATGHLIFNGAKASGATGHITALTITFDVVGAGTSVLNLEYSAMAATVTYTNLLPILVVTDSQIVVGPTPTPTSKRYSTYLPLLMKRLQ